MFNQGAFRKLVGVRFKPLRTYFISSVSIHLTTIGGGSVGDYVITNSLNGVLMEQQEGFVGAGVLNSGVGATGSKSVQEWFKELDMEKTTNVTLSCLAVAPDAVYDTQKTFFNSAQSLVEPSGIVDFIGSSEQDGVGLDTLMSWSLNIRTGAISYG